MRTSLTGHIHALGARFRDEGDTAPAAHVDDVQTAAGFLREVEGGADGGQFRLDRP